MKVIRQETEIIDKLWSHVELVFEVIKSNSFVAIDQMKQYFFPEFRTEHQSPLVSGILNFHRVMFSRTRGGHKSGVRVKKAAFKMIREDVLELVFRNQKRVFENRSCEKREKIVEVKDER